MSSGRRRKRESVSELCFRFFLFSVRLWPPRPEPPNPSHQPWATARRTTTLVRFRVCAREQPARRGRCRFFDSKTMGARFWQRRAFAHRALPLPYSLTRATRAACVLRAGGPASLAASFLLTLVPPPFTPPRRDRGAAHQRRVQDLEEEHAVSVWWVFGARSEGAMLGGGAPGRPFIFFWAVHPHPLSLPPIRPRHHARAGVAVPDGAVVAGAWGKSVWRERGKNARCENQKKKNTRRCRPPPRVKPWVRAAKQHRSNDSPYSIPRSFPGQTQGRPLHAPTARPGHAHVRRRAKLLDAGRGKRGEGKRKRKGRGDRDGLRKKKNQPHPTFIHLGPPPPGRPGNRRPRLRRRPRRSRRLWRRRRQSGRHAVHPARWGGQPRARDAAQPVSRRHQNRLLRSLRL